MGLHHGTLAVVDMTSCSDFTMVLCPYHIVLEAEMEVAVQNSLWYTV